MKCNEVITTPRYGSRKCHLFADHDEFYIPEEYLTAMRFSDSQPGYDLASVALNWIPKIGIHEWIEKTEYTNEVRQNKAWVFLCDAWCRYVVWNMEILIRTIKIRFFGRF